MNTMSEETKIAHLRLEAWGNWSRNNPELRPYPVATLLHRVAEQGPQGAAHATRPPVEMPEQIRITEIAVLSLPAVDRSVVASYYLEWAAVEQLAARLRMSESRFNQTLKRARMQVLAYAQGFEDRTRYEIA
jgi:DNA-directed RNA polymerase specialized sigma24 family protein